MILFPLHNSLVKLFPCHNDRVIVFPLEHGLVIMFFLINGLVIFSLNIIPPLPSDLVILFLLHDDLEICIVPRLQCYSYIVPFLEIVFCDLRFVILWKGWPNSSPYPSIDFSSPHHSHGLSNASSPRPTIGSFIQKLIYPPPPFIYFFLWTKIWPLTIFSFHLQIHT